MAPAPKKPSATNKSVATSAFGVNDWTKKDALRASTKTRKMTDAEFEAYKNAVAAKYKAKGAGALTQAERDVMTGGVRQMTSSGGAPMAAQNAPTRDDFVQKSLRENRQALTTATDVATMVGGGGFSAAKGAAGLVKGAVAAGRAAASPRLVALAATEGTRAATKGLTMAPKNATPYMRRVAADKITKAADNAATRPAGMASAKTLTEQRARDLAAKQAQGKVTNLNERTIKGLMRPDVLGVRQPGKALMPSRMESVAKSLAGPVKTTGKMPVRADFKSAKAFNDAMKQYKANVKTISSPKPKAPVEKKVSTTPAKPEPVKPVEPVKPSTEAVIVPTPKPKVPKGKTGKKVSTTPEVKKPSTDLVVQAKPPAVREPITVNARTIPGTGGPTGSPAAGARSIGGTEAAKAIGGAAKTPTAAVAAAKEGRKFFNKKNAKRTAVLGAVGTAAGFGLNAIGGSPSATDAKAEKDGKYRDKWGREITKSEADHRERWWQQNKDKDEKTFTKAYEAELARRDKWRKTTGAKSLGEAASTITRNQDVPGGISPKFWRALSADQQQKLKAKYAGSKNKRFGTWRSSIGKQDIGSSKSGTGSATTAEKTGSPVKMSASKANEIDALTPTQKKRYFGNLGSMSPEKALADAKAYGKQKSTTVATEPVRSNPVPANVAALSPKQRNYYNQLVQQNSMLPADALARAKKSPRI